MNRTLHKPQAAFTILELLVAMAIIGILIAMGLRVFGGVQEKARDNRRKQDLQSISKALEMYYNDFGRYPLSSVDGFILGCGEQAQQGCLWSGPFRNSSNGTLYMGEIPQDPSAGARYFYQSVDNGLGYYLFAHLENEEDPRVVLNAGGEPSAFLDTSCVQQGGAWLPESCNYLLKSSNLVDQPAVLN